MFITSLLLGSLFTTSTVHATTTQKRGDTFCFPAKSVPKLVDKIGSVKDKYRNIVDVKLDPKFLIKDGGIWPERFYLAQDGITLIEMPFSKEDGRVQNFMRAVRGAPDSDICVDDPTRADRPVDDEGLYFEMGLSPFFENRSGSHTLSEIREGAKDGKQFYKKMLPSTLTFLMPKTNHLAVKYDRPETALQAYALVDGQEVALPFEQYKDFAVISCDDLEALKASHLIIKGGPYQLQPVPSPNVMRRFGWGQEQDK